MKIYNILSILTLMAVALATPSCDDDSDKTAKTPLAGTVIDSNATYNSLTFTWDAVKGATQYGYTLYRGEQEIVTDVTGSTRISFTDLDADTEYTLKVWAYAPVYSDNTTSEPVTLTGKTLPIVPVKSPVLQYSENGNSYQVTWDAVANATSYDYSLNMGQLVVESGNVKTTALTFTGLGVGDYTVTVTPLSTIGGYSDGKPASISFTIDIVEVYRVTGIYTSSILDRAWKATLVSYSNSTYTIEGWYGVEGYNLNFYTDFTYPDYPFYISSEYPYDSSSESYEVPTGLTGSDKSIYVYPYSSEITGDADGGTVTLCVYGESDWVYDTFKWGSEVKGLADDYVGTWTITTAGTTCITSDWEAEPFDYTWSIEITKVDDFTLRLPALYFSDEYVEAVIDPIAKNLTIQPTTVWSYYIFAGNDDATTPVVGKVNDDGSISFNGYCGWYDGYKYVYDTTATLTRE